MLVVDCGLGIDSAEAVLDTARRLAPGREIVLTLTHAHPEHGFGAQVFAPDARIFYNAAQAEHLARAGQGLLDGFRAGVLPPEHQFLLDGIEITPPEETYDGAETRIDLGGREAVL
ncbi:MAG: MBL fold metallo-hydrolase, partial [Pseudomonadota bacterium]